MAEVKLLLKSSSDQAKQKLIREGLVKRVDAQYYLESLEKYDSVDYEKSVPQADYVKH